MNLLSGLFIFLWSQILVLFIGNLGNIAYIDIAHVIVSITKAKGVESHNTLYKYLLTYFRIVYVMHFVEYHKFSISNNVRSSI